MVSALGSDPRCGASNLLRTVSVPVAQWTKSTGLLNQKLWVRVPSGMLCWCSSVGKNACLINRKSLVRVQSPALVSVSSNRLGYPFHKRTTMVRFHPLTVMYCRQRLSIGLQNQLERVRLPHSTLHCFSHLFSSLLFFQCQSDTANFALSSFILFSLFCSIFP